ncbi:MAG: 3-dehydroquinate dehydratase [Firmicutes bacterium]|nr:3-dehydroquinate dehydratase [Bacillota bacterium]
MRILVINGPNLNLLGIREPDIYGKEDYNSLLRQIADHAGEIGVDAQFFQSNHEGAIVDAIQNAYFDAVDGIVINPAAYTHTSVAIADALKAVALPAVEVHISQVEKREAFRQTSYVRDCVLATVSGQGFAGYLQAIDILKAHLEEKAHESGI